jgi:glyoxylase-like metal-dependent hydrolase (beta-lactamase superfamily II)
MFDEEGTMHGNKGAVANRKRRSRKAFWMGLGVGAFAGFFIRLVLLRIRRLYHRMWCPLPTGRVSENLYAIRRGNANLFIYSDRTNAIAVDATYAAKKLQDEFELIDIDPGSVTHLFLTHTDFDHTGGLGAFPHAQIYLSRHEKQMIDGTTPRMLELYHNPKIEPPYTLLENGDVITVGAIRVEAIATPGHTPGSMCYLVNDSVLFTGDTLALQDGQVRPFYRLFNMDMAEQRNSIRRLAQLRNIELLCTAHTGCSRDYAFAMEHWHEAETDGF